MNVISFQQNAAAPPSSSYHTSPPNTVPFNFFALEHPISRTDRKQFHQAIIDLHSACRVSVRFIPVGVVTIPENLRLMQETADKAIARTLGDLHNLGSVLEGFRVPPMGCVTCYAAILSGSGDECRGEPMMSCTVCISLYLLFNRRNADGCSRVSPLYFLQCRMVYLCSKQHQKSSWPLHKFCCFKVQF